MKIRILLIAVIILAGFQGFATAGELGVSYGSGALPQSWSSFMSTPLNINLHYSIPIDGKNMRLSFSAGYGWVKYSQKADDTPVMSDEDSNLKFETTGFPIEAELLFAKPLTADNQFSIFLGIGAGYYNYEYRMESENNDNSGEDKIDITGVAQYFTFGSEVKVADRTSAFLQFKKPGFSFIKAKTTGDYSAMEEDAKPLDGFWDVGIAVGVRWSI